MLLKYIFLCAILNKESALARISLHRILYSVYHCNRMGCIQQRPKKIYDQPQQPQTSQKPSRQPSIKNVSVKNNSISNPPTQIAQQRQNTIKSVNSIATTKSNGQIIKKYIIQPKQSTYRTPPIHTYNYQSLIQLNPTAVSLDKTQRSSVEKSITINQNPQPINFNDPHHKLLLTKQ